MAGKDDDSIAVEVDDLDSVTVDVSDDANLKDQKVVENKPVKEMRTRTPRVSPDPEPVTGPTPEQALIEAQAFAKQQEDGRRAAEATAATERQMREQAQRQASDAQRDAEQQRERATNSELAVIDNGIAAAQQQIDSLQEEYTRAAEAGEFSKMGQIQTKLSKAAAALDRLENNKATFDVTTRQTTEGRVEAQTTTQLNAVDRYLSQFSPTAQSWLRQHPECMPSSVGGSDSKYNTMMQGHYAALSQNLREGSPEYFKAIEDHIVPPVQQAAPVSKAAEVQAAETRPAKQVIPSAPPSREAPTAQGQPRNVREVRLTKDQQEMAKVSFPHLPEAQAFGQYARNLIELEAEGKIGRSTH